MQELSPLKEQESVTPMSSWAQITRSEKPAKEKRSDDKPVQNATSAISKPSAQNDKAGEDDFTRLLG